MKTIIAGRVQLQDQAEATIKQLINAGVAPEKITSFYVNPPGQHAVYPIGGDCYQSPGIEEMDQDIRAASGVIKKVAEAVIGVAKGRHGANSSECPVTLRRAGMLVAIELTDPAQEQQVTELFKQFGATDLEKAQGEIVNGEWRGFDPLSEPCYL